MVTDGFIEGLLVGVLGSAVLGVVARQVMFAMRSVRSFFQPPVVAQKTPKSPAQVFSGCVKGVLTLILMAALVLGLVVVALSGPVQRLLQR